MKEEKKENLEKKNQKGLAATCKKVLYDIFIDGLSGMAIGLFATLIMGTIIIQISTIFQGPVANYIFLIGKVAQITTGAGIGCGVAYKLKSSPLTMASAIAAGMIGAFASNIDKAVASTEGIGMLFADSAVSLKGLGDPLSAFLAAITVVYIGKLVSGKTKVDILVTPFCCILCGATVGLLFGPPISSFMSWLGQIIQWATEQAPFTMGIVISVLMGIILTLPISSAALGVMLGLSGTAAGAATVGCCANMIGFAVASFRENKWNGLLAQGLGTSMIQISNIVKKPVIWLPAIITSAILGPVSTMVFKMTNNPIGSGMGTSGLVGQINTYQTMVEQGNGKGYVIFLIILMQIVLPAILSLIISEIMRKMKWIKDGDMKLNV